MALDILAIIPNIILLIVTSVPLIILCKFEKVSWTGSGFIVCFMSLWIGVFYCNASALSNALDEGIIIGRWKVQKQSKS